VLRWTESAAKKACARRHFHFGYWLPAVCHSDGGSGLTPEGSFRARVQPFAFTGAVYLAAHGFSSRWLATAIGVTQCLGMLGGSAGQFVVGPWIEHGVGWQSIWHWLGIASLVVGVLLVAITPSETRPQPRVLAGPSVLRPYAIVFRNPQS